MKRILLWAWALSLTAALQAQTPSGPAGDSLALRRQIEAENVKTLSSYAARPAVIAVQRVPRTDFQLWLSPLTGGVWGADGNWYPDEATELVLSLPSDTGDRNVVLTRPLDDTLWTVPATLGEEAVSPGDEFFPMRSPDGRRIYFASDGLPGMGGFDLFVATWDPQAKAWSVRNMGVPFNSPGDDLLFCDTPDGRYSLLVSNRDCDKDAVNIFVLRQETPVFEKVSPEQAATLTRLAVNASGQAPTFVKRLAGKTPAVPFDQPEEEFDETFRVGKEGAFAQNNHLPAGLVYQIQLFVSSSKVTIRQLKGVSPVYMHPQRSGKTLYAAGLFRTFAEAEQAVSQVRKAGFSSAFVIAFDGGQPLSLSKAKQKESSVKVVTEEFKIVK